MMAQDQHISTFLLYTALVALCGGIILPVWWQFDFLPALIRDLLNLHTFVPLRVITVEELKTYDGKQRDAIYLALLGRVYDVTKGRRHYGEGGSYSFFAARDATRAFVTGNFKEDGLTDDIAGLTPDQHVGLDEWVKSYDKDYTFVGVLAGRFYTADGKATEELNSFEKELEMAKRLKEKDNYEKQKFPECNSEWTKESGVVVWCSTESGGVKRSWEGLPRRFYKPGQTSFRCACIHKDLLQDGRVSLYPGCSEKAKRCHLSD